jgi:hypothetical protein
VYGPPMNGRAHWVFPAFLAATAAQCALLVGVTGARPSRGGIVFMLVLVGALGYGSRLAWGLLVILNGVPLLALLAVVSSGGHTLWLNVAVMVLTSLATEALLLSPAMRRHLAARRDRRAVA